jgi:glycogen debranching enzyme
VALTILEGSTFCVSDERGDISDPVMGLFADDTRFLSRWILTINGERPLKLSSDKVEYYSAAFYLRNPIAGGLEQDVLSIGRDRFIGDGMQEHIVVQNHAPHPVEFELALEVGTDFADIFAVKEHDFALGHPDTASPLPGLAPSEFEVDGNQFIFTDGPTRLTQVLLSEPGEVDGSSVRYTIALEPRQAWRLRADVIPSADGVKVAVAHAERRFGDELSRVRSSLSAWHLSVPQLQASWEELAVTFRQSVADLASLRMDEDRRVPGQLPAAGMPWFMTVFGRDTLVTCLQTLLFGPELAHNALRVLAALQAVADDPSIDAEPGKIVHEVRHGKGAEAWFPRYYGTVDATPLYLVLLSEVWRWTGDASLVEDLRVPALRALAWTDEHGDLDGDGFVEYKRRVDSLTSNIGHLLWSGIVPAERADAIVDQLMGDELWSGWGVRTMSSGDGAFNPLSYHNGTVWPHDNSLIAWGLARYQRWPETQRIGRRMLTAAGHFGHQLPEVFAGFSRSATPFPIAYPTAARPQAWAAGTPVLLLQLLLGLRPDPTAQALVSEAPAELPSWLGSLKLSSVRAFERSWDVRLENGQIEVEAAE